VKRETAPAKHRHAKERTGFRTSFIVIPFRTGRTTRLAASFLPSMDVLGWRTDAAKQQAVSPFEKLAAAQEPFAS
jgi:hypothetical protein